MKIRIVYTSFPDDITGIVKAITHEKSKNAFLIAIDDRNSPEDQDFSLRHELSHVVLHHFDNSLPLEAAEKEADLLAAIMTTEELMQLLA